MDKLRLERIWMMAKMEYLQRYYGTALGVFWAFLNPFFRVLIYYFAFSYLIFKGKSTDFILYIFTGITLWTIFSENTNKGLSLLKARKYLIQNIAINKIDLFVASALSTIFSLLLNILVYFIFTFFFDVSFSYTLLYLPLIVINLYLICIGASMIVSIIFLYFRDFKHIWTLLLFAGFWTVPIIWDYEFIFSSYPAFIYINPITGLLINFRNIVLYDLPINWQLFAVSMGIGLLFLLIGIWVLQKFSHKAVETQ